MKHLFLILLLAQGLSADTQTCGPNSTTLPNGECRAVSAAPTGGPCAADAKKHCDGFTEADGLVPCLKDHLAELNAGCRASLAPKANKKKR